MTFDPTVHFGDVMIAATVLFGGVGVFYQLREALTAQDKRLMGVESELKRLADVTVQNARVEERVAALALRMSAVETRTGARP